MEDDEEAAKKQSVVDLEELYVWLQQFEDPTIGKVMTYILHSYLNAPFCELFFRTLTIHVT
jgi:hypothetical protein